MSIVDDFSEIAKDMAKIEAEKKGPVPVEQREFVYWTATQAQLESHAQLKEDPANLSAVRARIFEEFRAKCQKD